MTTTTAPGLAAPPHPPSVLPSAAILAGRILKGWRSQWPAMTVTWIFPVLITLMFLGLFGGALRLPEDTRYADFLMPGMLAVTMLFGLEATTLSAAADASRGINDRFRSLPINSAAIVLAKCIADLLNSLIGLAVMVGFGLLLGWRPDTTVPAALMALALLVLLRLALQWVGIYVGYGARSVESVAYVQILVWPLALLSSVFVDPATMPAWLGAIAEINPVSTTASSVRDLLGTASWPGAVFAPWTSRALAVGWPVLLTVIFLPLAARSFRSRM